MLDEQYNLAKRLLDENRDKVEAMTAAYGLEGAGPDRAASALDARALRAFPEQWAKKHMLAPPASYQILESACHEGNEYMPAALRGARVEEGALPSQRERR